MSYFILEYDTTHEGEIPILKEHQVQGHRAPQLPWEVTSIEEEAGLFSDLGQSAQPFLAPVRY